VSQLLLAEKDKNIKAIILQINSPGGTVTACDMLYYELMEFKKRTGVKIIAAMMDVAASGGYYVSLPADYILAHPTTITGSIGVIFQRPVVAGFMDKVGLAVDVSVSGKNKDMGSPYRKSTEEERRIIQELTDALGQRFRDLVSKHRNLTGDSLAEAATARVFLAREALELGLIDQIGYLNDAKAKAREAAGLPENAKVVVYRRVESPNDNIYNTSFSGFEGTPKSLIDVRLPDATAFLNAGFYYVWSPADVDR